MRRRVPDFFMVKDFNDPIFQQVENDETGESEEDFQLEDSCSDLFDYIDDEDFYIDEELSSTARSISLNLIKKEVEDHEDVQDNNEPQLEINMNPVANHNPEILSPANTTSPISVLQMTKHEEGEQENGDQRGEGQQNGHNVMENVNNITQANTLIMQQNMMLMEKGMVAAIFEIGSVNGILSAMSFLENKRNAIQNQGQPLQHQTLETAHIIIKPEPGNWNDCEDSVQQPKQEPEFVKKTIKQELCEDTVDNYTPGNAKIETDVEEDPEIQVIKFIPNKILDPAPLPSRHRRNNPYSHHRSYSRGQRQTNRIYSESRRSSNCADSTVESYAKRNLSKKKN